MLVQVQTDNHIEGKQELIIYLSSMLQTELERFSERIARVEVFLADENGDKASEADKRCTLEARIEGIKPVVVTHYAGTIHQAVEGATDKLIKTIERTIERIQDRKPNAEEATLEGT